MRRGGVLAIGIVLLAAVCGFGLVAWLKHLQGVAARKAAEPCVIPDERACEKDVDCVEVRCAGGCICNEACGEAISRSALKKEHHVCLVATMEPRIPKGCREPGHCKCESFPCRRAPTCVNGRCEMAALPDGGAPAY